MQGGAKPSITILTCVWQRPELTDLVLDYYSKLRHRVSSYLDLSLVAVGSEGEASRSLCEGHGWIYVEHPNQPLGAKWNAGLPAVRDQGADAVLIVGSDDLLDSRAFELYVYCLKQDARFVGLLDMFFYEHAEEKLFHWPGFVGPRQGEPIGLGRLIHREYLEWAGWKLWDDALTQKLDRSAFETLAPRLTDPNAGAHHKLVRSREAGIAPVDIKTATNMWSFAQVAGTASVEFLEAQSFFEKHFGAEMTARLRALTIQPAPQTPMTKLTESELPPEPETMDGSRTIAELDDAVRRWIERGRAAFTSGHHHIARQSLVTALTIDGSQAEALGILGAIFHEGGDHGAAERCLLKSVVMGHTGFDNLYRLAQIALASARSIEAARLIELCIESGEGQSELVAKAKALIP